MSAFILVLLFASPDTLELTLDQALRMAFRQSPARAEVKALQTQSASTLARGITSVIPSVSGSVGYAKSTGFLPESLDAGRTAGSCRPSGFGSDWSWTGTLSISQVVFDPAVFAGLVGSVVYSGYYATDARDKQARLIYDVTTDYLSLLKTQLLRDAARAALRRTDENLKIVQAKERLGSASRIDVMRSEVVRSQAEIGLLGAKKGLAVAAEAFKATVNISEDVAVKPAEELTEPSQFEMPSPESLLAEIKRRNPGLALAAKANTVARVNLASSIGKVLPSVSAYWTSSYSDSAFPSSYGRWNENDAVSYGLRASFPLLDLKSYILNIVDAANESRRARAAAATAVLQIRSTALAAVLGYEEAKQTYHYSQRNLKLNKELYELAKEQQRLGAISLADLLSVEANLAQAQATYVSALCDTYIQAAQINYLLGVTGDGASR